MVLVYVPMTILLWVHARLGFSGSSNHVLASTFSISSQKVSNCNNHWRNWSTRSTRVLWVRGGGGRRGEGRRGKGRRGEGGVEDWRG